jgi:hypothetical protein
MTPWLSNSPTTMDLPQEAGDRYTADEFADMIVDQFDEMLAQSARQPPTSSSTASASG